MAGIADEVVAHVPAEIEVAVTSSPVRGIEATLRLCDELASAGFDNTVRIWDVASGKELWHLTGHGTANVYSLAFSLDGRRLLLQCLLAPGCEPTPLLDGLAAAHDMQVWLENLALPEAEEAHGGCGKPDCGRGEGGCASCGEGGCSSCGAGPVDLKPYFAHLREQMEERRTPLL